MNDVLRNKNEQDADDHKKMLSNLDDFFRTILGHLDSKQQNKRNKLKVIVNNLMKQARLSSEHGMGDWFNPELYAEFETTLFENEPLPTVESGAPKKTPLYEFPPVEIKKGKGLPLRGGGEYETQYSRRANAIPNVNKRLLAEIGTDLKYRLESLPSSKWTSPFLKPFGIKTRKQALVDEAIATLTRLSQEYNNRNRIELIREGDQTWYYNPLTEQTTWDNPARPMTELVEASKTTGPLGKRVVRENIPKYAPIEKFKADRELYSRNHNKFTMPKKLYDLIYGNYPKDFGFINLNEYEIGDPVEWKKFNTIFIRAHYADKRTGHVGVLIRNLTEPLSYTWYDSHGTNWRNPNSFFYPDREELDSIVGYSPVDFNGIKHQCNTGICKAFAQVRATYGDLSNIEYDRELKRVAREIAADPSFFIDEATFPVRQVGENRLLGEQQRTFITPPNPREVIAEQSAEIPPVIPADLYAGQYYQPGSVYAEPLVFEKQRQSLYKNPQIPVPFSTAQPPPIEGEGKYRKCKKCGLPKLLKGKAVPENLDFLQQMAKQSYNLVDPQEEINGWSLIRWTPTMKFYMKGTNVIVAIRGTKTNEDVMTWSTIPLSTLETTSVYKKDKAELEQFQRSYSPTNYNYYAVGHSLSGAIIDEFLRAGLIKEGLSYNPAIQYKDINAGLLNRRIYYGTDPLYKLMGWWDKTSEHREIENRTWAEFLLTYSLPAIIQDSLASHKVDSFKGIKGGKKKKKLVFT
jgi:hypothetical protein